MGRLFNLDNPVMNALNKLADLIRTHLDMDQIYKYLFGEKEDAI